MLEFDEALPQDFTFIGQWGVTADRELRDIFWMRSRHYDAQLGRFLSFDPLGKSTFNKYYKPFDFQKDGKIQNSMKIVLSPSLSQMVNRNISTVFLRNHSYENGFHMHFHFHANKTNFYILQMFGMRTRFEI